MKKYIHKKIDEISSYWIKYEEGILSAIINNLDVLNTHLSKMISLYEKHSDINNYEHRFLLSLFKEFTKRNKEIETNIFTFNHRSNVSLIRANFENTIILNFISKNLDKDIIKDIKLHNESVMNFYTNKEVKKPQDYAWAKRILSKKSVRLGDLVDEDTKTFFKNNSYLSVLIHNNDNFSRMDYQHYDFGFENNIDEPGGLNHGSFRVIKVQCFYMHSSFSAIMRLLKRRINTVSTQEYDISYQSYLDNLQTYFEELIKN